MDVLLTRLKKSGIGCHIGNTFCGAIGYADNVSLLRPSLSSLRMLLNITDVFGREFNLDFNPNKYQLLVYRNNDESVDGIYHNNSFVRAQQYGNHLGNFIGPNVGPKDVSHVVDNLCIDLFNKQMLFQSRGQQLVNKRYAVCCLSIEFFSGLLLTILILVLLKTHPLILFQEMIKQ